jgi:hypothetical protein
MVATQRHFLQLSLLSGCRLTAADVNSDTFVNTVDIVAIQRFFLGASTGTANVGKYRFSPVSRSYPAISGNQTGQNYDTLVFGDVAANFVFGPEGGPGDSAGDSSAINELVPVVATVELPNALVDVLANEFVTAVVTSNIDPKDNLIGFQGDFTFDSTAIGFESEPVEKAGLTSGNWTVAGAVLDGPGPIKTLRISAFSNDFVPLSGSGALFHLRMVRMSKSGEVTQLFWAQPPDHFIFIDVDLKMHKPGYAMPGSITPSWSVHSDEPAPEQTDGVVSPEEGASGDQ